MGRGSGPNPAAWFLWLIAAAAVPVVSRNPLYLALDFVVVLVVYLSLPRSSGIARAWRLFVTVGWTMALFSIAFNVLTVHSGDRTFARLPDGWPIIGGRLTWNAFTYGLISALAISTLLIAAATFNTAVRQGDIIRLLPGSFASLGIAGGIAMTMVPVTIAAARDIYDAQRARGHRFRGIRDARSFIVPLLTIGLERSMVLAEALETRGFGTSAAPVNRHSTWALPLAALLLLGSLAALGFGYLALGLGLLGAATALALAGAPSRGRRTRYRRLEWNRTSVIVAAVALLSLSALAGRSVFGAGLEYFPFPRLLMPPFESAVGIAILLLLAPLVWSGRGQS